MTGRIISYIRCPHCGEKITIIRGKRPGSCPSCDERIGIRTDDIPDYEDIHDNRNEPGDLNREQQS
jgi:DNA-directed RNA polymerase subunit RPC12/RpoP